MDLMSKLLAERDELSKKLDENSANIAELSGEDIGRSMIERASDAIKNIPPDRWLINGLMPSTGFGVIGSPPYTGKTFIATHIAGSVASGRPVFGHFRVNQAVPVLYVYFESSRSEFLFTMKKSLESRGIKGDNIFVNAGHVPSERMKMGTSGLEAAIRATGAKFIVMDTLSFATQGDESNEELQKKLVAPTVDLTRKLGCYILYVHHSQKQVEGVEEIYAFRGGSVLPAGADTLLRVDRIKGDAKDSKYRRLGIVKARGSHSGAMDLELDFPRRVCWERGQDPREILWEPKKYEQARANDPWPGEE